MRPRQPVPVTVGPAITARQWAVQAVTRLYHYLEAKWALDDIRRRRLKVSTITDLNDPYEFESVYSDDLLTQHSLNEQKKTFAQTFAVVCFSRSWNSVLMWSHYADKHKGICLGFDVADHLLRPIRYVARPENAGRMVVEEDAQFDMDRGEKVVKSLLEVKYEGWEYEREVRMHATRNEKDGETGQYFVDFSDKTILREVIAGPNFSGGRAAIEEAVKDFPNNKAVKIMKARVSSVKFEVVEGVDTF